MSIAKFCAIKVPGERVERGPSQLSVAVFKLRSDFFLKNRLRRNGECPTLEQADNIRESFGSI